MTEDTFNIDSCGYETKVSSVRHLALTQPIPPMTAGLAPIWRYPWHNSMHSLDLAFSSLIHHMSTYTRHVY